MAFLAAAVVGPSAWATHSADRDASGVISLSELLRVVQFFNFDGYQVAVEVTEDGYAPGAKTGTHHDSDYAPRDWFIGLWELLRLVQFFNAGGYYGPVLSEDGFAPGTQGNPYLLPVAGDRDGDYLTDEEEGYLNWNADEFDENGDGVLDGVGLAVDLARQIAMLPPEFDSDGPWRTNSARERCTLHAPFSEQAITLTSNWLANVLIMDTECGSIEPAQGALHFLENGSFSYHPVGEDCAWHFDETVRCPVHLLYYLPETVPERLPGTHMVPLDGDTDGEYLTDAEEAAIGYACGCGCETFLLDVPFPYGLLNMAGEVWPRRRHQRGPPAVRWILRRRSNVLPLTSWRSTTGDTAMGSANMGLTMSISCVTILT